SASHRIDSGGVRDDEDGGIAEQRWVASTRRRRQAMPEFEMNEPGGPAVPRGRPGPEGTRGSAIRVPVLKRVRPDCRPTKASLVNVRTRMARPLVAGATRPPLEGAAGPPGCSRAPSMLWWCGWSGSRFDAA